MPRTTKSAIAAALEQDGYAYLEQWHADVALIELVQQHGVALNFGKSPVHRIVPQQNATPNTYSGIYGLGEFPLHTDMAHWPEPPRYMLLRCVKGQSTVATTVLDAWDVIRRTGPLDLARALVKPRRPLHGTVPLLTVLRAGRPDRAMLFRWDDRYIVPASSAGQLGMNRVRAILPEMVARKIHLCKPGDTLWLDNWRILHGRSSVPHSCTDRVIERVYLGDVF